MESSKVTIQEVLKKISSQYMLFFIFYNNFSRLGPLGPCVVSVLLQRSVVSKGY